ncbi:MAG: hypothetical protein WBW82_21645, partial [Candidatus Sulfotelmatobacter sp.]
LTTSRACFWRKNTSGPLSENRGLKGNSKGLWKSVENLDDLHAAKMVQWLIGPKKQVPHRLSAGSE